MSLPTKLDIRSGNPSSAGSVFPMSSQLVAVGVFAATAV
jgi:hypothetical protein